MNGAPTESAISLGLRLHHGNAGVIPRDLIAPLLSVSRQYFGCRLGSCTPSDVVIGSHSVVPGKSLQIVVLVCLVTFALAYPVIESLDHWDAPNPASDSELEVIDVLTFAGAIFLLTQTLAALPASIATQPRTGLCFCALWKKHILLVSTDLTASPPVALRI
jgi:hypothetical protein